MSEENSFETRQALLCASLVKAIAELDDVQPDSQNPFHKNVYASLSAHLKKIKPVFAKHGLAVLQCPIGTDTAVGVRTIVVHEAGGSLESDCLIKSADNMDGQKAGSIISYLRRYSLAAVAGISTADDDAETVRESAPAQPSKFVANPSFKASSPAKSGEPDFTLPVPFGKAKGTALQDLPVSDLNYWANTWEPKPWEKTGKVNPKDLLLKKSAQALYAMTSPQPSGDDVPY